jgi:hypothetical protein
MGKGVDAPFNMPSTEVEPDRDRLRTCKDQTVLIVTSRFLSKQLVSLFTISKRPIGRQNSGAA